MWRAMVLMVFLPTAACDAKRAEWSSCVVEDEFETCAEMCQAQDMMCVATGCSDDPSPCTPNSCDIAASMLSLDNAICVDESMGSSTEAACEVPIEFHDGTARCCCEALSR